MAANDNFSNHSKDKLDVNQLTHVLLNKKWGEEVGGLTGCSCDHRVGKDGSTNSNDFYRVSGSRR
jgi:hypothetical protein